MEGGHFSFLWIVLLTLWFVPYNAEFYARRHQVPFFQSLVGLDLGLKPGLPGHGRILYPLDQPIICQSSFVSTQFQVLWFNTNKSIWLIDHTITGTTILPHFLIQNFHSTVLNRQDVYLSVAVPFQLISWPGIVNIVCLLSSLRNFTKKASSRNMVISCS